MRLRPPLAAALAAAFLGDGPWTADGLRARGASTFESPTNAPDHIEQSVWFERVVAAVLSAHVRPPRDAPESLAHLVARASLGVTGARSDDEIEDDVDSDLEDDVDLGDDDVDVEHEPYAEHPQLRRFPIVTPRMSDARRFDVPPIATLAELASFLSLPADWLDWFADTQLLSRAAPDEALRHYRWRWIPKRGRQANAGVRLLATPKPTLRAVQRRILRGILDVVPAHDAAHGFCRGRSAATYAAPHAGREIVVRLDLADFFVSVRRSRVRAIYRALGYPEAVARVLAGLCTSAPPRATLASLPSDAASRRTQQRFRSPHLPQGAPTSPALANLCAFALDTRLRAAATTVSATYTRYADDLAFSGDAAFARRAVRFVPFASAIALAEGFDVRFDKTRIMRRGTRQTLAGLVVNARPVPARDDIERLESTLVNCLRRGAHTQNRDEAPDFHAHLRGRVAHVAAHHPARGARLKALFDAIDWSEIDLHAPPALTPQ